MGVARLPKKFWRVIQTGDKRAGHYEIGNKTYAAKAHAQNHVDSLRKRGIECELYETEPVVWKLIDTAPPKDMDPLW